MIGRSSIRAAIALMVAASLWSASAAALDPPHDTTNLPNVCETCHIAHAAFGTLFTSASVENLCRSCHFSGGPALEMSTHKCDAAAAGCDGFTFEISCNGCHDPHSQDQNNVHGSTYGKFIKDSIITPNSGTKDVIFTGNTGTHSFADDDATLDGICEVCHTSTAHHLNSGTAGDDSDHNPAANCTVCHPHEQQADGGYGFKPAVSGGACPDCHGPGVGSKRSVNTDFAGMSHHIGRDLGAQPLSKFDCVICHLEGDANGDIDSTYHNTDPAVNLRDVDDAANTSFAFTDPDALDNTPNSGTCAAPNQKTLVTRFCLRCHDSNGVGNSTFISQVNTNDADVTRSAKRPFGAATDVLDVNQKTNPSNFSTHSLSCSYQSGWTSGQKNLSYPGLDLTAWANSWTETSTTECADCHMPANLGAAKPFSQNAHGSANTSWMLDAMDGTDTVLAGSADGVNSNAVCFKCHNIETYAHDGGNATASRMAKHTVANHMDDTLNIFGLGCLNCHGGGEYGGIHGTNLTITDNDSGLTTDAVMFINGSAIDRWSLSPPTAVTCSSQHRTQVPNAFNLGCKQHSSQSYTRNYP